MPLASNTPDHGWFSRERVLLLTLGLATLLALYLCYLIVQPFIPAVTIAFPPSSRFSAAFSFSALRA